MRHSDENPDVSDLVAYKNFFLVWSLLGHFGVHLSSFFLGPVTLLLNSTLLRFFLFPGIPRRRRASDGQGFDRGGAGLASSFLPRRRVQNDGRMWVSLFLLVDLVFDWFPDGVRVARIEPSFSEGPSVFSFHVRLSSFFGFFLDSPPKGCDPPPFLGFFYELLTTLGYFLWTRYGILGLTRPLPGMFGRSPPRGISFSCFDPFDSVEKPSNFFFSFQSF